MDLRSNPGRRFKIGWPGWFAGDGGGGTRRSSLLCGGATRARRSSVLWVFLGLNQLGVWPGMINVERMIHQWQRLGSGRGFVAARAASGGPARRGLPACGALTIAVAYRLQKLAQKGDKVGACLTEVRIGRGGRAGSSAAKRNGARG